MLEFYKLDLTQSLLKLEYICLQKNIRVCMITDLKSTKNNFKEIIIFKEGGVLKQKALIDTLGEIWVAGVPARDWNTKETMYVYEMLEETLKMIPFTEIDPEKDLDSILDKINKWGINSLLKEEFEFLFSY